MKPVLDSKGMYCALWLLTVALFLGAGLAGPQSALGQDNAQTNGTNPVTTPAQSLDGLQFSAGIIRSSEADSGNAPLGDTLVFKDGEFSSAICERYNFSSAPYWIRQDSEQIHFLAELSSPTDGKMVWQGTVRDGKLEGTMRWTRKRWYWTIDVEHNIRGEVK